MLAVVLTAGAYPKFIAEKGGIIYPLYSSCRLKTIVKSIIKDSNSEKKTGNNLKINQIYMALIFIHSIQPGD
jgi:hypothetical protein